MTEQENIIYRQIEERYVKVAETHKIHECQSELWEKEENCIKIKLALADVFTTCGAIGILVNKVFSCFSSDIADWGLTIFTAVVGGVATFFTFRYKDNTIGDKAKANKQHAAKCHDLRNKYESLLTDIKSKRYNTMEDISKVRDELEKDEALLYESGNVPNTTSKAVEIAMERLKKKKDSQTSEEEIESIVPEHLQIKKNNNG